MNIYIICLLILFSSCKNIDKSVKSNELYKITRYNKLIQECGYINENRDTIVPFGKYSNCYTDTIKTIGFVSKHKNGIFAINKMDSILFKVYPFDNGPDYMQCGVFRILDNNDLIGFADINGNIIIKPKYANIFAFSEGLAIFSTGTITGAYKSIAEESVNIRELLIPKDIRQEEQKYKCGYIDLKGDTVIPPIFDNAGDFKNGKAEVIKDGREFFIDKTGKEVSNPTHK